MKTFEYEGDVIPLVVPATGVTKGLGYQVGQLVVVAVATVAYAVGATFSGLVRGVCTVAKPGLQAWTQGQAIYYDQDNLYFTTVAAGNRLVGAAAQACDAGADSTTGHVFIDGAVRLDS